MSPGCSPVSFGQTSLALVKGERLETCSPLPRRGPRRGPGPRSGPGMVGNLNQNLVLMRTKILWWWLAVMVPCVALAGDETSGGVNGLFESFFYNGEGFRIANEAGVWVAGLLAVFTLAAVLGLGIVGLRLVVRIIKGGLRK